MVNINCKKLAQEDNGRRLIETRLFCDDSICADTNNEDEEHVLFPTVFNSPFSLIIGEKNKYSTCLAYFEKFFNQKDECPKMDNDERICIHSDAVKISYSGGTKGTVNKSKCGLAAMRNIIRSGLPEIADKVINQKGSKVFGVMMKEFISMGYKEGFSLAGVPLDYRRFVATNRFAIEAFKYQINKLYENTGKPVIIIAHSHGTISTLNYLVQADKTMLPKIKKFVAMAPPFAGSTKLLDVFLNGNHDFDGSISLLGKEFGVKYDKLGQSMIHNAMPVCVELRPLASFDIILKDPKYSLFGKAIQERIQMEDDMDRHNGNIFSALFKDIPSLDERECINPPSNKYKEEMGPLYNNPCTCNFHNFLNCPTISMASDSSIRFASKPLEECGKIDPSFLYNVECNSSKMTCLDSIYTQAPYPYEVSDKLNNLIKRFNNKHSMTLSKTIDYSFFESKDKFRQKFPLLLDYHSRISKTKILPIPPVDTLLLFSKFEPTGSAFIYNPNKLDFEIKDSLYKGGDGTVPSWSSYLTGLKWLYDKKIDNLPQEITLVEYCSQLHNSPKYKYDPNSKKSYYGIECDCIKKGYDIKKLKKSNCEHATLLNDKTLIEHIKQAIIQDSHNLSEITNDRRQSVSQYNSGNDYEAKCNNELKQIFDNE